MDTLFNTLFLYNSSYGAYHIVWICIVAVLITAGSVFLKKAKLETAVLIMLIIGIVSETMKVGTYIVVNEETLHGYLPKTDLPFHLCSIQIIFLIIIKLTKNEGLKRLLLAFMIPTCLIGGAAAIFLPTSSSLNIPVISMQYFVYHAGIVWFAIHLLQDKDFNLTLKDYRNTFIFLYATFFVAIYLNSWIYDGSSNINFMYVVKPPASGLPLLNTNHGWLVYIVHYAFIAFVAITCFYIKPWIEFFKSKKNKKEASKAE